MPRIIHFEIPADDPQRAVNFYSNVFGWEIEEWPSLGEYWLVTTGSDPEAGIDGAILKRNPVHTHTVNSVEVPSLDEFLEKVAKNGGKVVQPRTEIADMGWVAYFSDTEGNIHGIFESKKTG